MRIGLMHDSLLPPKGYGGIERLVVKLAEEYRRRGHQVVLLCRAGSYHPTAEVVPLPVNYKSMKPSYWLPDLDFLHAHEPLSADPGLPYMITIHGNGQPEEKYLPNCVFVSRRHAQNHGARYFVLNGVDPTDYPMVTAKQDYYVFLARTTWRVKNLKTAIHWAKDLGVRLEIMGGSGPSEGKIRYNGEVSDQRKMELLSYAKALIFPTNWEEPCAAAPIEAMACGTPVITSVNGSMPELVTRDTGVLCRNYNDLLQAPKRLIGIRPTVCRSHVEEHFSLARVASDYLALMARIIDHGSLDHRPRYNFQPNSVQYIYKPTIWNQIQMLFRGKV